MCNGLETSLSLYNALGTCYLGSGDTVPPGFATHYLIDHSIVSPLTGRHNKAFSVYSPAWSTANRELENLSSPIF
jgi:hypothetical protein